MARDRKSTDMVFCVVTRLFDAELPYVRSFVQHYIGIGVQRFFFVNTFHGHFAEVRQYISSIEANGATLHVLDTKDDTQPVNGMSNEALKHPEMGEYVINVDVDEYWVLPQSTADLKTLVRRRPADVYWFGWLMKPTMVSTVRFECLTRASGAIRGSTW